MRIHERVCLGVPHQDISGPDGPAAEQDEAISRLDRKSHARQQRGGNDLSHQGGRRLSQ